MSKPPTYVDHGMANSFPGPFECRDGEMRILILEGKIEPIRALVDKLYNEPAEKAVEYMPVSHRIILQYGLNIVASTSRPEDGKVAEQLAAFWVPVWGGSTRNGRFHADRLCMALPHILVDNPLSHIGGREIYGFPKALGIFDKKEDGEALKIQGYGGPLDPESTAAWHPLVDIAPAGGEDAGPEVATFEDGVAGFIDFVAAGILEGSASSPIESVGGVELDGGLCDSIRSGVMRQVFLKQFRETRDHTKACYQAVVEAPARTKRVDYDLLPPRRWRVRFHPLESHPIARELGLELDENGEQTTWLTARMHGFDFDVYTGEVVGPPDQVPDAPSTS